MDSKARMHASRWASIEKYHGGYHSQPEPADPTPRAYRPRQQDAPCAMAESLRRTWRHCPPGPSPCRDAPGGYLGDVPLLVLGDAGRWTALVGIALSTLPGPANISVQLAGPICIGVWC